ncbi:MAG: cation/multidrug efflux system outer rane porin [Pseudomonadota bacterium]|jgi:cobalt-zinc-cadmium efflux system outer membrane protein
MLFLTSKRTIELSIAFLFFALFNFASAQNLDVTKLQKQTGSDLSLCPVHAPDILSMTFVIERAIKCSPDLSAYRLEHELVVADRVIAGQRPNPNLSLGADSINSHPSQGSRTSQKVDSTVRIDQLVELGGKAKYRIDAATNAEVASKYFLKYAEKEIIATIQQFFYEGLSAQQKEKDLYEIVEMNKKVSEVAAIRFRSGDISKMEYNKIILDVSRTENEYKNAKSDLLKAKETIAKALAFNKSINKASFAPDWPNHNEELPVIPWEKISKRNDLQAFKSKTQSAEASRNFARSLKTPDVTVGLQYNHLPVTGSPQNGTVNTYLVNFTIPLFVRHQYQGESMRAEAEYYKARDLQVRAERDALVAIELREAEVRNNQEKLNRMLLSILPSAEQTASAAEFAYSKGAIGVLEVIDSRRSLRQVRTEASQIRADFAKSLNAFKLATFIEE